MTEEETTKAVLFLMAKGFHNAALGRLRVVIEGLREGFLSGSTPLYGYWPLHRQPVRVPSRDGREITVYGVPPWLDTVETLLDSIEQDGFKPFDVEANATVSHRSGNQEPS